MGAENSAWAQESLAAFFLRGLGRVAGNAVSRTDPGQGSYHRVSAFSVNLTPITLTSTCGPGSEMATKGTKNYVTPSKSELCSQLLREQWELVP